MTRAETSRGQGTAIAENSGAKEGVVLRVFAGLFGAVLGVALLIVWTLTHMALLSWADLSYVMPVTAISYVVTAFAARLFLGESVSTARWIGIVLVTAGVTLVGRTAAATR